MNNPLSNKICAASMLCLAFASSCRRSSSWPKLRDEHCGAIAQLKSVVDSNVASVSHSLERLEVPSPDATEADKFIFHDNCVELRRDVREIAKYLDGFTAASHAIVDARPEGDLAPAGLSERFEVSMMSSGFEIFRGCSDDISPKAAVEDLSKSAAEVDGALDDALGKCRTAGWKSSAASPAKSGAGSSLR